MKKTIQAYTNDAPLVGNKVNVAYFRLNKEMKDFLDLVNDKEKIIGFEWEEGSYNFGIIVKRA